MRRFWRRDKADWPEPRAEFLQSLSDEVRSGRGRIRHGGLRLAFVVVGVIALLVPVAAIAGRPGTQDLRAAVKAVTSAVNADTSASPKWGKPPRPGHGNYNCPNYGERRRALARHQKQERDALKAHQRQPHPGLSKKQLQEHFKAEWRALHAHQKAEREQLKRECGKGHGHHKP